MRGVRGKCKDCEYKCDKCEEIAAKHIADEVKPAGITLCWCCKHAIPVKDKDGRYSQGCPWTISKQPVNGWDVSQVTHIYDKKTKGRYITYLVKRCPLFERG